MFQIIHAVLACKNESQAVTACTMSFPVTLFFPCKRLHNYLGGSRVVPRRRSDRTTAPSLQSQSTVNGGVYHQLYVKHHLMNDTPG